MYQLINKTTSDAALYVANRERVPRQRRWRGGTPASTRHARLLELHRRRQRWTSTIRRYSGRTPVRRSSSTTRPPPPHRRPTPTPCRCRSASTQWAVRVREGIAVVRCLTGASARHRDLLWNGSRRGVWQPLGRPIRGRSRYSGDVLRDLRSKRKSRGRAAGDMAQYVVLREPGGNGGHGERFLQHLQRELTCRCEFPAMSAAISAPDAGLRDAGIYSTALTSPDPSAPLAKASDLRAISDDVGTGGQGGVGLALIFRASNGVYFAYLNSDGGGIQGLSPSSCGGGPGTMSMTNFNGSFAISSYTAATHSAQVIETGICPYLTGRR